MQSRDKPESDRRQQCNVNVVGVDIDSIEQDHLHYRRQQQQTSNNVDYRTGIVHTRRSDNDKRLWMDSINVGCVAYECSDHRIYIDECCRTSSVEPRDKQESDRRQQHNGIRVDIDIISSVQDGRRFGRAEMECTDGYDSRQVDGDNDSDSVSRWMACDSSYTIECSIVRSCVGDIDRSDGSDSEQYSFASWCSY